MKYYYPILCLFSFISISCEKKQMIQENLNTESNIENPLNHELKDFNNFESLPNWVIESGIIEDFKFQKSYQISSQLNPYYLEEDFNGDKIIDCIIAIKEIKSEKIGFAYMDGKTKEINIIGAGKHIKNALTDDFNHMDIWKINRQKEIIGTEVNENGELIDSKPILLEFPSINILKSESGGGIIYWNGNEFEYVHQNC